MGCTTAAGWLALLLLSLCTRHASGYPCTPARRGTCAAPPGGLAPRRVPQFVLITWDDAVSPQAYGAVQSILGGLRQRNGCPVPSTFFVTTTDTVPEAVQALYLGGHEIATHTMTHQGYPSPAEILGARDWLANHTGIPPAKINGFRAPFLLHNAETRKVLAAAGFLYDSSISDTVPSLVSRSTEQRTWPYCMTGGIPQACETGECSPKERYPLWEVPLWTVADAAGKPLDTMDPPGDAFKLYTREVPRGRVGQERKAGGQLARRLAGNRAPLGLFFHAGMESQPDRVAQLRRFIAAAAATRDVWFVTTQQLLRWMAAPAAAGRLRAAGLGCKRPTDIKGRACATYVSDCVFGSWEARRCRCACLGEGSPGGYCSNRRTEQCTEAC